MFIRKLFSKSAFINFCIFVITLFLILLFLEIGTRFIGRVSPPIFIRDPVIGAKYVPNFQGDVYDVESKRNIHLRFNRDGFRGPDHDYTPTEKKFRIAVLGDSMIAAIGTDEEQTAVAVLERLLHQKYPAGHWEVMNFGLAGASTGQELVLYRELVSRYHPDLVIVAYFVGNDFSDNCSFLSSNPRIYFNLDGQGNLVQQPFSYRKKMLSAWINQHSRFYVWFKQAIHDLSKTTIRTLNIIRPENYVYIPPEGDPQLENAWNLNAKLIQQFKQEVEKNGSKFLLALLPIAYQIYDNEWSKYVQSMGELGKKMNPQFPDRQIQKICEAANIACLIMSDNFSTFAAASQSTSEKGPAFLNGLGHFSDIGNRWAAESILNFLEKHHLIPSATQTVSQ